jgi:hypothetical protein
MTLVDSNVILDLIGPETVWFAWSRAAFVERAARGPMLVNDVIYAECAVSFATAEQATEALALLGLARAPLADAGLHRAAHAFRDYRRAGGPKGNVLSDFFVGAHAEISGLPLLTRDTRRYATYFPSVRLITPSAA